MMFKRCCIVLSALVIGAAQAADIKTISFGRFGTATVYVPANVRHAALFFSDAQGWTEADGVLAQALADHGILVAGVDWHHYAEQLAKPRDKCSYIAGEFEDFSHEMQKRFSPARHHLPVLIGEGASAPLVYAVAAQGSSGTFVGTLTIGFQPHWQPPLKLCQSYELRYSTDEHGAVTLKPSSQLSTPWIDLHASSAKTFSAADLQKFVTSVGTAKSVVVENRKWREPLIANVEQLALPDREQKILADELKDLPLEEVRATGTPTSQMAMFLTGDGGWAEIDKGVSTELSKRGIDVVALSSLQYFWKPRSPDETAKDVARVVRHYLKAWNKSEVLLVGYSFGADVAPFVVNRLPDELRTRIVSVNLLGLAELADFEVHVTTWLGVEHHGLQTKPEVERLDTRVLCVFGEGEKDSLCPSLTGPRVTRAKIGDGHHFGDQYKVLADRVIAVSQNR